MKKLISFLVIMSCVCTLQAKTLIVYYSYTNNVHRIVSDLQTQIQADVLRIEPAEEGLDYAANNYALGSALIAAIRNDPANPDSYPAIKTSINNLDEYDTIIIGAPLWWSNMAAPLQTFLFTYGSQMAGKRIGLIVSSASSGISGVEADAKRLIPDGNFMTPSLWIRSSQTENCHSMLSEWLKEINYENTSTGIINMNMDNSPSLQYRSGQLFVSGDMDYVSIFNVNGSKVMQTDEKVINNIPVGILEFTLCSWLQTMLLKHTSSVLLTDDNSHGYLLILKRRLFIILMRVFVLFYELSVICNSGIYVKELSTIQFFSYI